jgi:hypothetical protein
MFFGVGPGRVGLAPRALAPFLGLMTSRRLFT